VNPEELPETTIRRLTKALDKVHRIAVSTMGSGGAGDIMTVLENIPGYELPQYKICDLCGKPGEPKYVTMKTHEFYCEECHQTGKTKSS
jgi:hypothetical protein